MLLPDNVRQQLPPLYAQEKVKDPIVYAKFFFPGSHLTWYATEFDGEDEFFGWVYGDFPEMGYFSLSEMESVQVAGLRTQCDQSFQPTRLSIVKASHGEK